MNLTQLFSILRARRVVALSIFLITVALALAWVLLRPSYYTARAPVLVDVRSTDPLGSQSWQPAVPASYMATQIDIVRSDRVAERVVEMLGLDKEAKASEDWRKATGGRGSLKSWLAGDLQAGLDVKPARESNVINISWTGRSPQQAAQVANAFSQAYLDVALDIKTDPAKKYSSWFDEQLKFARDRLQQAQDKLTAYQQRTGVIAENGVDMETQRLNELSSQLTMVQGQLTDVSNKRGAAAGNTAEAMSSPLINSLKADIARQEARVQEASANLGARHPQMIRMQDELNAMRSRLASETGSIGSSINTAYEVGRARERELQAAVSAQRARVMQFNRHRDELSVLRRDLEAAQKAYEAVSERASQSKLQALSNQTNIQRLATAVEPLEPKGPGTRLALAVAAIAGLLLALAGAILMELLNRRVRSVDDLSMATHLPILATVPAHNGAAALARLANAPTRPALAYRGSLA
ncbi:MAG TPA: chain length determinant protein EpsF [Ramlibacter sp.]|jgi:chain length determinant protein EpsF|uniref:chain length determinant protein EpsF n=1 Tax=Ramlibacter sp. TaxID=1917967 RepID=UPI002D4CB8F7|nr:chain length determinant protein EpsF [Ramlibacter sp.]HZY19122.1 chain length determinant protein EpsF [Ramlibacter sp.]